MSTAVYKAIGKVMAAVTSIAHDATHGQFRYSYLSEDGIIAALRPAMVKAGLALTCTGIHEIVMGTTPTKNDGSQQTYTARWEWCLSESTTGESIRLESVGVGWDNQDKAALKARTQALKSVLRDTFLITSQEGEESGAGSGDGNALAEKAASAAILKLAEEFVAVATTVVPPETAEEARDALCAKLGDKALNPAAWKKMTAKLKALPAEERETAIEKIIKEGEKT